MHKKITHNKPVAITNDAQGCYTSSLKINKFSLLSKQSHYLPASKQGTVYSQLAPLEQQQSSLILNTSKQQDTQHHSVEHLLHRDNVILIDSRISEFYPRCHNDVIFSSTRPLGNTFQLNGHYNFIRQLFYSLNNELFHSPLTMLVKNSLEKHSNQLISKYHDCFDKLISQQSFMKLQIQSIPQFFTVKTFDKPRRLAKDKHTQEQLGHIKDLFQHSDFLTQDVGHND